MRMRTVRVDSAVDGELEDARREWRRVDDAWEMIEWVLMRDPTKGTPLTESGTARSFVFDGSIAHEMPTIQIVYVVDENYITIKAVIFSSPTFSAGLA
jgi:hypothetical protein